MPKPKENTKSKIESLKREPAPGAKIQNVTINRAEYLKAINKPGAVNRARVVRVFSRTLQNELYPEYRLFDVRSGSIYRLLKLQTADILISGEGLSFVSDKKFFGYVSLLRDQDQGRIEIRRNGQPIIFKYVFVDL